MINLKSISLRIIILISIITINLTLLSSQDINGNDDIGGESENNSSLRLLNSSLDRNIDFDQNYISKSVIYTYYFRDKLDFSFLMESPDYYDNPNFPYSNKIDSEYLQEYPTYYIVYYDLENKVLREDYYENGELVYYILNFYELSFKIRERVAYLKNGKENNIFDYFHYKLEDATVLIKYNEGEIQYLNVKYKNNKGLTLISEAYNQDLIRHGIWYYYRYNGSLRRKEYWENGVLIKYITYDDDFDETYHDGDGNVITQSEFFDL